MSCQAGGFGNAQRYVQCRKSQSGGHSWPLNAW
jgi:hypothetical protein